MERELCWYPTIIAVENNGDEKVYKDDEGCTYVSLHTTELGAQRALQALRGQHFIDRVQHNKRIIFGVW